MRFGLMAIAALLLLAVGYGCQREDAVYDNAILMTVGQREFRQDEFQRAYRVFRSAYAAGVDEDPAAERASKTRFIQQLADQLVLLEYAEEIGVEISPKDLNTAIDDIRSDYPDDLFEQMLLENAINFEDWKEALRVRLVIDQLVQQELALKVQITEKDIADYYQKNDAKNGVPPSGATDVGPDKVDQLLVQQLRRQKAEQAYAPWIADLKAKYPVAIDQRIVSRIIADSGPSVSKDGRDGSAP